MCNIVLTSRPLSMEIEALLESDPVSAWTDQQAQRGSSLIVMNTLLFYNRSFGIIQKVLPNSNRDTQDQSGRLQMLNGRVNRFV
jgi:hypothetical protein